MKKVNPFEEKDFIPVEGTYKNWQELATKPYDKKTASPYTKTRVILMNGTEFESNWFLHQFSRNCNNNELRREISKVRRHEQQQQKMISSLKPIDESNLETTISYEQLAVDLTAILAKHVSEVNVKNALNFALLEDFDHLYRYSNLLKLEQGKDAFDITKDYTEIMPARPTIAHHRHPNDAINHFQSREVTDLYTKLAIHIITGAEQQTMNYYMNIGNHHPTEMGRKLYAEIAMVEEQHVTEYGSLMDANCTWLENWVMHEYTECYLYYSCFEDESDPEIKKLYYHLYLEECGHLNKAAEMLLRFEGKPYQALFPQGADFPELLKFEGNIDYIRDVIKSTICITKDRENYIEVDKLSDKSEFKKYNKQVNKFENKELGHVVIETAIKKFGTDYRFEKGPHPIKAFENRTEDNINIGRWKTAK